MKKKEFYNNSNDNNNNNNNPIQSYQLCSITAYSGVDLKKKRKTKKHDEAAKIH